MPRSSLKHVPPIAWREDVYYFSPKIATFFHFVGVIYKFYFIFRGAINILPVRSVLLLCRWHSRVRLLMLGQQFDANTSKKHRFPSSNKWRLFVIASTRLIERNRNRECVYVWERERMREREVQEEKTILYSSLSSFVLQIFTVQKIFFFLWLSALESQFLLL